MTYQALRKTRLDAALYTAVQAQDVVRVRLLLAQGADPNVRQQAAGKQADTDRQGFAEFVKSLRKLLGNRAIDPRDYRETALMATNANRADIVKLLLDAGASLNLQNGQGYSALIAAARGGHAEIVKILADKGANVNLALPDDWTPLLSVRRLSDATTDTVFFILIPVVQANVT